MNRRENSRRRPIGLAAAVTVGSAVVALLAVAGSASTAAVPANTSPPTISGTPQQGQQLTGSRGTWSNDPTDYNDFWLRCDSDGHNCVNIKGATGTLAIGTSYTLTAADVGKTIRFEVEAVNAAGSSTAVSMPTATVAAAPLPSNTSPPTVSGTPQAGKTLTGNRGSWANNPSDYNYFWRRCGVNQPVSSCSTIGGANNNTYTLTSADVGNTIRFRVEAKNAAGSSTADSAPTAKIAAAPTAPANTSPPTVSGTPQQGQQLTGNRGGWSNNPTSFKDFWLRCDTNGESCARINGANSPTYTLTSADVGNTLRFQVEASNDGGATTATSVPTTKIAAAPPPPPPPATGCPGGNGTINVNDLKPPARLLLDGQQANPSIVHRGAQEIVIRYHVSACGGRPVQGALVYSTAVPFNQLSIPPEQATGQDGWAELRFHTLRGFPVSPHQQLIALFARARKPGENLLGGISTRRLFSLRVNLHG